MSSSRVLPLFPLNTTLFPGQALSLHIFEERYKLMVNQCLREDRPIGVVLIQEGDEVGLPAIPHNVGTLATITETERQENGEFDIVAVGQERFVIREIIQMEPYLVGHVDALPTSGEDSPRAWALSARVREVLPAYVDALAKATGTVIQVMNVPDRPSALAFLIALALQVRPVERQKLLATGDVADMLAEELRLLGREAAVWRYMARTQQAERKREDDQGTAISDN